MKGDVMDTVQPSNEKLIEWLIDRMKDGSPVERRVPKILKDRFNRALFRYGQLRLSKDESMEFRECDASNFRKCIAVWGVLNIGAPVPNLDLRPFPPGYHEAAKALREVCDELSHYLNGGAADYCAAPVVDSVTPHLNSKKSSVRGKAIRKKDDYAEAKKLWDAWQKPPHDVYCNKQQFISDLTEKFQISAITARNWFDRFRPSASPEWEAVYGDKYPIK